MSNLIRLSAPRSKIDGEIEVPGSKSYTNRALILATITDGVSTIHKPSLSDDSNALISALTELGVKIVNNANSSITVYGAGRNLKGAVTKLNVGPAGTTYRFLTALISLIEGAEVELYGSARMHERPISPLVDALRSLGARIDYLGKLGCPPLRIHGSGNIKGGKVSLPGDISSQFFSSLLMIAPLLPEGLIIDVISEQISRSYIDMTLSSMREFGVTVENQNYKRYLVGEGERYRPKEYTVEGDCSGASYLWAIGAIGNGIVRVKNINVDSLQGDIKFPELLSRMGAKVDYNRTDRWIEVSGATNLSAISCDMTLMPDTAQTLAVVSALATGCSTLTGLSTLRIKETDRISALSTELKKMKIETSSTSDSISVVGGSPVAARIATYDDHRMAMAFATLAARIDGIEIEDPEVTTKSFPDFWSTISKLGIEVSK